MIMRFERDISETTVILILATPRILAIPRHSRVGGNPQGGGMGIMAITIPSRQSWFKTHFNSPLDIKAEGFAKLSFERAI